MVGLLNLLGMQMIGITRETYMRLLPKVIKVSKMNNTILGIIIGILVFFGLGLIVYETLIYDDPCPTKSTEENMESLLLPKYQDSGPRITGVPTNTLIGVYSGPRIGDIVINKGNGLDSQISQSTGNTNIFLSD